MSSGFVARLCRFVATLALTGLLAFGQTGRASAGSIIYVKANASGSNSGASWSNAFKSLQTALGVAGSGDQIWVAQGSYKPTAGTNRGISFVMKNGVAIYGGFAGTESALSQRHIASNPTYLTGDIGVGDDVTDNSYHVVTGSSVNSTAVLDGFHVVQGNASAGAPNNNGGGILIVSGSPTLRNLTLTGNHADNWGGAIYSLMGTATLKNVTLSQNNAGSGGGLFLDQSSATLTDVLFDSNHAIYGGALYLTGSSPTLTRLTFSANWATYAGGAMYNNQSSPSMTNAVFNGNWAVGSSGTSGGAIYNGGGSAPIILQATFSGNYVDGTHMNNRGGAIYNEHSSPTLIDVTFSGNAAKGPYGAGGAIFNLNVSNPIISSATFSGNTATGNGGALYYYTFSDGGVYNSIFWGNSSQQIYIDTSNPTIIDSLIAGGCPAGASCGNLTTGDPKLGPLQNNGGFVKTMALLAGSAAIDTGGQYTTCPGWDARKVTRSQGLACDIGAYEVKALKLTSVAAYDGFVTESAKGSGIGGSVNAAGSTLRVGDDAGNRQYRSVFSFNTAAVPDGATLPMVRLRIRQSAIVGTNPFTTHGTLWIDVTKPYFGTGLSLVKSDFQAGATVSKGGTVSLALIGGFYGGLLNSTGRGAVNKTGTTQLRLRFNLTTNSDGGADYLSLLASDSNTVADSPTLIVYYNP